MSSKNHSALASLTATYTDSENEDERDSDGDDHDSEDSKESQVIIPSRPSTPIKVQSANSTPTKVEQNARKAALRLVSYHDDTYVSDEDDDNLGSSVVITADIMPVDVEQEPREEEPAEELSKADEEKRKDRFAEYGFTLPEVKGKCPAELQDKITKMYERMKMNNLDMNAVIQGRKEFRNPSIYEKLIQYCDIDELGTNYPAELYNPSFFGKDSYYEELSRLQRIEMEKKDREVTKNEMVAAATKKVEEEAKKRKSKWDQPAPGVAIAQHPTIQIKSGLLQPSLTTTATGTKGTVISAFGSLPKKPKV